MFSPNERAKIIALINREVVPAIGCTEPIAVALCTAHAAELLDTQPEKIEVRLSANILKNAMGVGIPGTGMIGLPIAVALGALVGRSEYQLEVLRDVTPEAVGRGARYIDEKRVCISLKEDIAEKLYIEVEASAGERRAVAVIAGGHTAFVYLERDGEVLLDKRTASVAEEEAGGVPLTLRRVWDFAMTAPLDELRFILETRRVNKAAAERAFAGEFGHCVGRTLRCERERRVMGDSIFSRILSYTSAACDARMAGAMIPVMSNSGSGNQGIAATLPGTAPELIRNYLEVRGVGVIDVEKLFGVGAVQDSTQIDLVIQFEKWEDDKFYDRLGLDENDTTILDVPVPQITIPVSAGRNLAAIVELAAMNNRQKKHGFNSAREFAAQIDGHIDRVTRENELKNQNP